MLYHLRNKRTGKYVAFDNDSDYLLVDDVKDAYAVDWDWALEIKGYIKGGCNFVTIPLRN